MKYIFVKTPDFVPNFAPVDGIPHLMGILKSENIDTQYVDLFYEFRNLLLNKNFVDNLLQKYLDALNRKNIEKYSPDVISVIKKNKEKIFDILKYIKYYQPHFKYWFEILQDKKLFYLVDINSYIIKQISTLYNDLTDLYYIFLSNKRGWSFSKGYGDSILMGDKYEINIDLIAGYLNSDLNFFKEFYDSKIEDVLSLNPDIVGITIGPAKQLLPALYFAKRIKEKNKNIHINIGGSFFSIYWGNISNLQELFGTFFDSISIWNNRNTVIKLCEYVQGKIPIEEVPNLVYNKNEIKVNIEKEEYKFNKLPYQNFEGFDKKQFRAPELLLPIKTSENCYWGKCIFCECSAKYKIYKTLPVKRVVDELEYLSKKYKTKYFYFWDNAIHPKYLNNMADEILNRKLDIKYTIYARLEKEFTYDLLKKMYNSGCIAVHWGVDTASKKLLKIINKGIDIDNAKNIFKAAYSAGIYNFAYFIPGMPTENDEDIEENIRFIKENKKYINQYSVGEEGVLFVNGSIMTENYDYYNKIMTLSEKEIKEHVIKIKSAFDSDYFDREKKLSSYMVLYIAKFGNKQKKKKELKIKSFKCKLILKLLFSYLKIKDLKNEIFS